MNAIRTAVEFITTINTIKVTVTNFTHRDAVASASTLKLIVAAS